MQRSLIDHRAGQKRIAVVFQGDGQALKPVCPLSTQMALDPDLIDHWLICFWVEFVCHVLVPVVGNQNSLGRLAATQIVVCTSPLGYATMW